MSDKNLVDTLLNLDKKKITYVCWKNISELNSSLIGLSDLDLFVPNIYKSKFIDYLESESWIELINPISEYPGIKHFYKLGKNSNFYHIHVYFKLITGNSWIKEYILPFDDWIVENREWNSEYKIWVLNSSSQAYLFIFRHFLKNSSIIGRILYKKNFFFYKKEWEFIYKKFDKKIEGPIDIKNFYHSSGVLENKLELPKLLSAMQFRKLCNSYLRFNSFLILFNYYKSFIKRFFNKLFFRRKKILPKKGIIIAISGVDGSGKTTMLKEINNLLSKIFTINQFHLGRPLGSILEFLWRNLGNKSKDSNMPGTINYSTSSPMGRALNSIILGFFRFLIAKKIKKKSNSGILILTDRWPTSQIGKMDGPRIIISKNSNFIIHFCKKVEQWLYNKMPKADICYVLTVPLETALERNRLRIKKNKETQKHIRARYLRNESFKPIANKTIYFENIEKMEINSRELINNIWNEIKKI